MLLGAYPVIDVAVVFVAVLLYWTSANRVVSFWLLARPGLTLVAAILAICLGGPVVEMFDHWDHTLQDGNDTEANVVAVAICVGLAMVVGTMMANDVPMQSCMRTSSGTPSTRNTVVWSESV